MFRTPRSLSRFGAILAAGGVLAAVAITGCGSSSSGSSSSSGGSSTAGGASAAGADMAAANSQLAAAYKGHFTQPPTDSNPPAKGKKVWVLSCGEQIPTCVALTSNMMEAGKKLGWDMHLYDGKGVPANYTKGINDAIAAGANGILPVSYDCPLVTQALRSAKKAGVKSIPVLGWDCGELNPGQPNLYTAHLSFGSRYPNQEAEYRASGEDMAAWVVSRTKGKANVLEFANQEFYTLKFQQEAFDKRLKQLCSSCQLTQVPYQVIDFGPKLQAKAKAALVKYPDANAMVGVPIPAAGPSPAVVQAGRADSMQVIGGYGLSGDTDLVRGNQGLNGIYAQPMGWIAYASVDMLNRAFNGKPQVDEGVGYGILDEQHNLPPAHQGFETNVDYKADYDKSWGVTG